MQLSPILISSDVLPGRHVDFTRQRTTTVPCPAVEPSSRFITAEYELDVAPSR
jgi:hypothetical protein